MRLAAVGLLVALGCAGAEEPAAPLGLELDAFSGRPNPTWVLDPLQSREVLARLSGIPPAGEALPDGGLGYRGFVLTGPAAGGFPGRARVYGGLIALGEPEGSGVHRDVNGLEPFLVELARQRGFGGVFEPR